MQWLIQYAFALIARTHRYQYGGDDPILGFDCSGLVEELLLASGEIPFGTPKMNAQGLYNLYEGKANRTWGAGALAFYGVDAKHIDHVAFCVDLYSMIEAGGGTAETVTDDTAIRQNAFVKMRPIKYRKDFLCVLKPLYSKIGMLSS